MIPAHNRRPILEKVVDALAEQVIPPDTPLEGYEVVVVDDGSTDGTGTLPVRVVRQERSGPAAARNAGVSAANFDVICFIDSDLVPGPGFLHAHAVAFVRASAVDPRCFTAGPVIETADFDDPTGSRAKPVDWSRAFFATGNVMIARRWLDEAGGFDPTFGFYGWEDLELGVRLKRLGLRLVPAADAVGYHWHPAFSFDQMPALIALEHERARTAAVFCRKWPTVDVRLMTQHTYLHRILWEGLTLGGLLDRWLYDPLSRVLIRRGHPHLALAAARVPLNRHYVRALALAMRASEGD